MKQPQRILFVHTAGGLGDLLLSSPVAEALKRCYPDSTIAAWVKPAYVPLLQGNPSFDGFIAPPQAVDAAEELLAFPDRVGLMGKARLLREGRFDLAVNTWTRSDVAWALRLAGIPTRVGQAGRLLYSLLYTHRVVVRSTRGDADSHWVDCQLDYARALGCPTEGLQPRIWLTEQERAEGREFLRRSGVDLGRPVCGLHVGKGLPIDVQRWPLDRFVDIGDRLCEELGCSVVLTGGASEGPVVSEVQRRMRGVAVSIAGKTGLRQLAAATAAMDLFVCPDSGPMHIAAALGVPVVAIFALASDFPNRWRPYATEYRIVRTKGFDCSRPCVKETCPRLECLLCIDQDGAIDAARELLART